MKRKIMITIFTILIAGGTFKLGAMFGSYSKSVELENNYPFQLGKVLAENPPSCNDYLTLMNNNLKFGLDTIQYNNKQYVRVITAEKHVAEIKLKVSILDSSHSHFVDDVWLECPEYNKKIGSK